MNEEPKKTNFLPEDLSRLLLTAFIVIVIMLSLIQVESRVKYVGSIIDRSTQPRQISTTEQKIEPLLEEEQAESQDNDQASTEESRESTNTNIEEGLSE